MTTLNDLRNAIDNLLSSLKFMLMLNMKGDQEQLIKSMFRYVGKSIAI